MKKTVKKKSSGKAISKIDPSIKVYGCLEHREKKPPSEDLEQKTIFNQLRLHQPEIAQMATHIKNEGIKSANECAKDAQMGLNAGFSDIIIIGNPTMVCELKKCDSTKSNVSDDQQEFLIAADKNGSFACVALGHRGFFEALEVWKGLQHARS